MTRRPVATLVVALLLAVAALLIVRRMSVDTSLSSLFDDADPAAIALERVMHRFAAVEELLILVESPQDQPAQTGKLIAFADRLDKSIANDPLASTLSGGVSFRPDPQIRQFIEKQIVPNAIFYLDDAGFAELQKRLTLEGMREQIRRDEALMSTPGPAASAMAKVILKDPLRLHELLIDRIAAGLPMVNMKGGDAFTSRDGRALLIRIRGKRPVSDLEFSKQFTTAIRELALRENHDHLTIALSGGYAIASRSEQAIRGDMIETVIGSVIGLQLLFILVFRQPVRTFLISFLPVALGVLYGFGVYAILIRTLSPMTAAIGGVLAGMAIDHSIAFLTFFHVRRQTTPDAATAARDTVRNVGTTLLAAWATSIAGFVVIGFSNVKALRDFSLLGGLGLTGAFICALIVHPAVLVLADRNRAHDAPLIRLPIDRLVAVLSRHRRSIVIAMLTIFVLAAGSLLLPGAILAPESDLSAMHPRPNPPLDALQTIAQRMGTSPGGSIIHLQADDDAKLVHLAHVVRDRLAHKGVRDANVVGSLGLASVLPDPAVTESRIAAARSINADQMIKDFRAALDDSILDPAAYRGYEGFLRTLVTASKSPDIATLSQYPKLAEMVLPTSVDASKRESIMLLFMSGATERREDRDALIDAIRGSLADVAGATFTGLSVLSHDAELSVRRDLPRLVLIALAAVAVYLAIHFRNPLDCALAILPTVFAFAVLLAFMRLFGHKLSMVNLVAFPLLIGIGIDYGIFIVAGVRQGAGLTSPVTAVVMCCATTVLGFASLLTTSVPAVQSMGIAVAIGVAAAALAAVLLVLPLCLIARARSRNVNRVWVLILVLAGCQPPLAKLTFPYRPLKPTTQPQSFDVNRNGRDDFSITFDDHQRLDTLSYDDNEDGTPDRVYRLGDYANDDVTHAIILLDSIPFQCVKERFDAGEFRWFDPPAKVIAPFPSMTEACYTEVLHAAPMPGMIDQHYDRKKHKIHNGIWDRFAEGYEYPWERYLHFRSPYRDEGFAYMNPKSWYQAELERARKVIDASPDRTTIVYLTSASGMACKYGRQGVDEVLDGAARLCLQLLYERRGAIRISLMADHGHNLVESQNIPVEKLLKSAGLHPAAQLDRPNDAVLEMNGLVTYAAVRTTQPSKVADALLKHEGVDMTLHMDADAIVVRSATVSARIERDGERFRYRPVSGDVLRYGGEKSLTRDEWFAATADSEYPDAPPRIWDAFHRLVIDPPEVMFTTHNGYFAGSPWIERYIKMKSTHGSFDQINSATFLMTMHSPAPLKSMRSAEVMKAIAPTWFPHVVKR